MELFHQNHNHTTEYFITTQISKQTFHIGTEMTNFVTFHSTQNKHTVAEVATKMHTLAADHSRLVAKTLLAAIHYGQGHRFWYQLKAHKTSH